MKRIKILTYILGLVMVCGIFWNTNTSVKAVDGDDIPCVDGSYLIDDEYSEVTVGSMTRGIYLKSGSSMISKAGTGKIAAGGNTIGQKIVSKISVTVRVQKLVNGRWEAYTSWTETEYNSAYAGTSKTLTVPRGYYYRVYCSHYANSDSSGSYTNGIYI